MEETTTHYKLREALDLAVWAGEIMFGSGSEIDKVERAINTLLAPSDCESVSILVAHNALLITTSSGDDAVTKVRPIMGQNVNFAKIRRVYALCKQVERSGYDPAYIRTRLEEIDTARPEMPRILVAVFVSLSCGAFASIFGGGSPGLFRHRPGLVHGLPDPLQTDGHGLQRDPGVHGRRLCLDLCGHPPGPVHRPSGHGQGCGSALSDSRNAAHRFGGRPDPGVHHRGPDPRGHGHDSRFFTGRGHGPGLYRGRFDMDMVLISDIALKSALGAVASFGFATLFNVPRNLLIWCALSGALALCLRTTAESAGVPLPSATLVGSVGVGIFTFLLHKKLIIPSMVVSIPGVINMIPGVHAYKAMAGFMHFTATHETEALINACYHFLTMVFTVLAIAVGLITPSLFLRIRRKTL